MKSYLSSIRSYINREKSITISFLTLSTIVICAVPALTWAANDVTLTTSTNILVGGYTLNVSGSSAVIDSITVNTSDFTVTLSSGSSIEITSPTYQQLSVSPSTFTTSNNCVDNASVLTLASTGASGTVTVTPSASVCSTPPPTPTSHSSSGSRASTATLIALGLLPANTPITPLVTGCPAGHVCNPDVTPTKTTTTFKRDLHVGSKGDDVKVLQQYLNSNGYTIAASGPGSLGNETSTFGSLTKKALAKFQKAHGISATGNLGPITRKYISK